MADFFSDIDKIHQPTLQFQSFFREIVTPTGLKSHVKGRRKSRTLMPYVYFEGSVTMWVVKVYVYIFGDERGKEVALTGLKSKAKYVRTELGRRMKLRPSPEIHFIEDEPLE